MRLGRIGINTQIRRLGIDQRSEWLSAAPDIEYRPTERRQHRAQVAPPRARLNIEESADGSEKDGETRSRCHKQLRPPGLRGGCHHVAAALESRRLLF